MFSYHSNRLLTGLIFSLSLQFFLSITSQAAVTPFFVRSGLRANFIVQGDGDGEMLWAAMAGQSASKSFDSFDGGLHVECRKVSDQIPVYCRVTIERAVNSQIDPDDRRAQWEVRGYLSEVEMLPKFNMPSTGTLRLRSSDHYFHLEATRDLFSLRMGFESQ